MPMAWNRLANLQCCTASKRTCKLGDLCCSNATHALQGGNLQCYRNCNTVIYLDSDFTIQGLHYAVITSAPRFRGFLNYTELGPYSSSRRPPQRVTRVLLWQRLSPTHPSTHFLHSPNSPRTAHASSCLCQFLTAPSPGSHPQASSNHDASDQSPSCASCCQRPQ